MSWRSVRLQIDLPAAEPQPAADGDQQRERQKDDAERLAGAADAHRGVAFAHRGVADRAHVARRKTPPAHDQVAAREQVRAEHGNADPDQRHAGA